MFRLAPFGKHTSRQQNSPSEYVALLFRDMFEKIAQFLFGQIEVQTAACSLGYASQELRQRGQLCRETG